MSTDWMPSTRPAQLAMAKRWCDLLPSKEQSWRIPEGMVQTLKELTAEAETLQDRADSPEGTKGDAARARTAFHDCKSLTSVTFSGTIPSAGFNTNSPFPGDLRDKFYATAGTYTRPNGTSTTWTKK